MKYSNNVLNVLAILRCKNKGNGWVIDNYESNMSDEILSKKLKNA